jgi:hypothetical protein
MLLLIFLSSPLPQTTASVTAAVAANPVDYEEIAAEQNCCAETQRLLGGTSLKLAFHQKGAQQLAGDVSTGAFRPVVPLKGTVAQDCRPLVFFMNRLHEGL